ncbi:hypothetical protein M5K25_024239 [Dendrobium thyrsiflorum]|uniref:Uncharacterized protein n=1 Tax=Dendrobium thyrsiflorum TaxID=117978 RepID=A0ABD0U1G7_DENTH
MEIDRIKIVNLKSAAPLMTEASWTTGWDFNAAHVVAYLAIHLLPSRLTRSAFQEASDEEETIDFFLSELQ